MESRNWTKNGNIIVDRAFGWQGAKIAEVDFVDLSTNLHDTLKSEEYATLIAAAPKMLAALEQCKKILTIIGNGRHVEMGEWLDAAEATTDALAQAKGENVHEAQG